MPVDIVNERSSHESSAVFETILAVCPPPPGSPALVPVAEALARLAGSRLAVADTEAPRRDQADVVAMGTSSTSGSGTLIDMARPVLDDGTAVLIVPPLQPSRVRLARIGVGYDGSKPAEAALATAGALADARPEEVARFEIAHIDNSASASRDASDEVLESRRGVAIQWWLEQLGQRVSVPAEATRAVGDPAAQLARLSRDLDLLVIGTRARAPLRRALTGSISKRLIAATCCPLLIVPDVSTVDGSRDSRRSPGSWVRHADHLKRQPARAIARFRSH